MSTLAPSATPATGEPAPHTGFLRATRDRLLRFLFGYDVFVSYARADALPFAMQLTTRLRNAKLAAYMDQLATPPGRDLPPLLTLRLLRSSMLLLVGSKGAADSNYVRQEVEAYRKTGRSFFVVNVEGALDDLAWYREGVMGCPTVRITRAELEAGIPSEKVVERILASADFNRLEDRQRKALRRGIAAFAAVLTLGAAAVGFEMMLIDRAAAAADSARARAAALVHMADSLRDAAATATVRARQADAQRMAAEDSAATARRRAADAAAFRRLAEASAARAQGDAREQQRIADALHGANKAVQLLSLSRTNPQWSNLIRQAADTAVAAYQAHRSAETDESLRAVVASLPVPVDSLRVSGGISMMTFSPNGRHLAVSTGSGVRVWDVDAGSVHTVSEAPGQGAVFSPRGDRIVVVGGDMRVRLVDPATGNDVAVSGDPVDLAVFTNDGRQLAVAVGKRVVFWDAVSGSRLDSIALTAPVVDMAWDPRAQALVTAESDREIRLWNASEDSATRLATWSGDLFSLEISPDSRFLALAISEGVRVLDRQSNVWIPVHERPREIVDVKFVENGARLAMFSDRQTVEFWNPLTGSRSGVAGIEDARGSDLEALAFLDGREVVVTNTLTGERSFLVHSANVQDFAYSTARRIYAVADTHGVTLYRPGDPGRRQVTTSAGNGGLNFLGNISWTTFADSMATLWSPETGRVTHHVNAGEGRSRTSARSADGRVLATASMEGGVRVWTTPGATPLLVTGVAAVDTNCPDGERCGTSANVASLQLSRTGRYLRVDTRKDGVRVWDTEARSEVKLPDRFRGRRETRLGADERHLVLTDGTDALLWRIGGDPSVRTCTHRAASPHRPLLIGQAELSPDGRYLATAANDSMVRILDAATCNVLKSIRLARAASLQFSPSGRYLVAAALADPHNRTGNTTLPMLVWDVERMQERARIPYGNSFVAHGFSQRERYLATATGDRTARVLDLATGSVLVLPHTADVHDVAVSPDEEYVATASRDRLTRVWRLSDGAEVARFSHGQELAGVQFSANGRLISTLSEEGVTAWTWHPDELIERALRPWGGTAATPEAAGAGRQGR